MEFTHITAILLSGASIALGAFFGAMRSKIFATKTKNTLHYSFYILAILLFTVSVLSLIYYWKKFFSPADWFAIIVLALAILASIALFWITKKYLTVKETYLSKELDPIVNGFTANADKNEIKLFGGDLNFFGNYPAEIDINKQYTHLRSLNFTHVLILCETPTNQTQKIRYGKILSEIEGVELGFYNPEHADLRVRGRIIKISGVSKLLMYIKVKSGVYNAIHTDTGNLDGALYNNIWDLVWSLAIHPSDEQIENYKALFTGNN